MHELSLAQSLWETVESAMSDADRLLRVDVAVGNFSGVEPTALKSAIEVLIESSPWPSAEVAIAAEPTLLECRACSRQFAPDEMSFLCTACGSEDVRIIGGGRVRLQSIDVE